MLIKAGEIISKSIELYRENAKLLLSYVVLFLIPTSLLQTVSILLGQGTFGLGLGASVIVMIVLTIVFALVNIWISIALIRAIAARYTGVVAKDMKTELHAGTAVLWSAVIASIIAGLAIFAGIILLIIPGIIFSIWFAFVMYSVVLDNKKSIESLKASKALVSGRWWTVLWLLLAPGVVFVLLMIIVQWIAGLMIFLPEMFGTFGLILYGTIVTAAGLIVAPLTTAAPTILYIELKKTPVTTPTPAPQK